MYKSGKSWVIWLWPILLVAAFVLAIVLHQSLDSMASTISLDNPGFEDGFHTHDGIGELVVADQWNPWWTGRRPEFKPESLDVGSGRVHSGFYAQKSFVTFGVHDGGMYQRISTMPGQWYEFSAYVWNWSSSLDYPDESNKPGKGSSLVGINPWGSEWPLHRTTVWGQESLEQYDSWVKVSVVAQAWSDHIVVFLRGCNEWPVKHNDWYWDDVSIQEYSHTIPIPTAIPGEFPSLLEIQNVVETVVADREPVRWP